MSLLLLKLSKKVTKDELMNQSEKVLSDGAMTAVDSVVAIGRMRVRRVENMVGLDVGVVDLWRMEVDFCGDG